MKNKVTKDQIAKILADGTENIVKVGEKTTVVTFTTKEGFAITESSSCVDPANYNERLGADICYEKIVNKLWELEGYCLQKELAKTAPTELNNTIDMMLSNNYQERFKAEYLQLAIRLKGLQTMLLKYEAGTLDYTPKCSYELLNSQYQAMKNYMGFLQKRAKVEKIDLNF